MAGFTRFEDIEAWQRARSLANAIYDVSDVGRFSKDFVLRDQMRRAVVSIMSNVAEGFERDGNGEFANFLSIAKASVGELQAQLYLACDRRYVTDEQFQQLYGDAQRVGRMIGGLIAYLRRSDIRGRKFRDDAVSRPASAPQGRRQKPETRNPKRET